MSSLAATSASTSPVAPSSSRRPHLRVGIIQRGRIVEERVLRAPRAVTIGPSAADTFVTPPDDEGGGSWRLFEERRGRLVLRLGPAMTARLAVGGEIVALDASSPAEGARLVPLGDGARGKITRGDTTVLFQLVRPPAPQPRPQLPASVRRRVVGDLDGAFTALVTLSFLVHLAMVIYLRQVDWPRKPVIDELPDRFVQMVRRPKPTPTPVPAPHPVAAVTAQPKKPAPAPARPAAPPSTKPAPSEGERRAELEKRVQKMGMLGLITSLGDGPSAATDLLKNGNADQTVEEAFKGVSGVVVASADTLRNLPRAGDGGGRVAAPAGLRGGPGIAGADTGTATERGVRTVIREGAPQVEDGKVDAAAIAREIRARKKALAACYERALKATPTLAGKLVIRFSLAAAGTVTSVDIEDESLGSPEVSACIKAVVLRWRFGALAEGPAELSFPFVFQPGG
jgi:hypothetical protein